MTHPDFLLVGPALTLFTSHLNLVQVHDKVSPTSGAEAAYTPDTLHPGVCV